MKDRKEAMGVAPRETAPATVPTTARPVKEQGGGVVVYSPNEETRSELKVLLARENLDNLFWCSSLSEAIATASGLDRLDLAIIPFAQDDPQAVTFAESLFLQHPLAAVVGICPRREGVDRDRAMRAGYRCLLYPPLAEDDEAGRDIRSALNRSRALQEMVRNLPFVNKLREENASLLRELEDTRVALLSQARRFEESQEVFYLDLSRMMSIIDSIVDGIIFTDRDARITLLNPVAERLLRVNSFLAIGKHVGELPGREELVQAIAEDQEEALEKDAVSRTCEINLESQDVLFLKVNTTAVTDYRGNFTGLLSVIQDVTTEFKADELKNQYLSIVSHELRTPLTGIKSFVSMMAQGTLGAVTEQQQRVLETVQEQTLRLEHQIDKLISLGMFEQEEFAQDYEIFPLAEVVNPAVVSFEAEAANRGIGLTTDLPPGIDDLLLQADKENIKRVLQILLENAIKFNRRDGSVALKVVAGEEEILFRVEDTGIGIEPRYQKRIFDKFFQVEAPLTRQYGGAGLGLTVAQRVLRSHDSEIHLESTLGQGSAFQFSLRRYRVDLEAEVEDLSVTGDLFSRERSGR